MQKFLPVPEIFPSREHGKPGIGHPAAVVLGPAIEVSSEVHRLNSRITGKTKEDLVTGLLRRAGLASLLRNDRLARVEVLNLLPNLSPLGGSAGLGCPFVGMTTADEETRNR